MSVKIRLRRTGKINAACHRIVVADSRSPRDGRFIEIIGYYDPRHNDEKVDLERADYWVSKGAQPSETVSAIIKRARNAAPAVAADATEDE
jgi:small subunit ribosomal protein S16